MCGIAGEWTGQPRLTGYAGRSPAPDSRHVAAMLRRLHHRGPDGSGLVSGPEAAVGMTRLAIQDPFGHAPPYRSEDGQVIVVLNGEIYNFRALRKEMMQRGHHMLGDSDGDVLPHLYEEWGAAMLPRLVGMFALAVYDRRRHTLLLARDRLGIKPLYLWSAGARLRFASELKAFLAWPDFAPTLRPDAVRQHLRYRFVPAPDTLLGGVDKLAPGHFLMLDGGARRDPEPWWTLPVLDSGRASRTLSEAADELSVLWPRIVADHAGAERARGLFLSGGIDSGWLAWALGSEARGMPALTLDGQGLGSAYDEADQAADSAARWGLRLERVPLTVPTAEDLLRVAAGLDEPIGDPTVITFDQVARAAKDAGLTVMLCGEGADEVFAGYPHYREAQVLDRLRPWARRLSSWGPTRTWMASGRRGARRLSAALRPTSRHYAGVGGTFWDVEPEPNRLLERYWQAVAGESRLKQMLGFDLLWYLGDDALLKCDRIGMQHQLEVRVPYVDHRLVEWAWALPDSLLVDGGLGKMVLRRAAARVAPALARRPKRGFPTPLTDWIRGPLRTLARDTLGGQDWLPPQDLDALWDRLDRGLPDAGRQLYTLLMLELWTRTLRDDAAPRRLDTEGQDAGAAD